MTVMTRAAFARHLGCRPSYVTKLGQAGRLVLTADGKKVEVEASIQRIAETRDPNRDDVAARNAQERAQKRAETQAPTTAPEPTEAPASTPEHPGISFQDARARKEHYAALKNEAEYRRMIGQLCDVADVRAAAATVGALLRGKIERLPDLLAPVLSVETEEPRVRAILIEHTEHLLADIAASVTRSLDDIGDPAP